MLVFSLSFLVIDGQAKTTFLHEDYAVSQLHADQSQIEDCCIADQPYMEMCCDHAGTDDCDHTNCDHADCCLVFSNIFLPLQNNHLKHYAVFVIDENFGLTNFSPIELHSIWIPPKLIA